MLGSSAPVQFQPLPGVELVAARGAAAPGFTWGMALADWRQPLISWLSPQLYYLCKHALPFVSI